MSNYIDNQLSNGINMDWNYIFREMTRIVKERTKKESDNFYLPQPPIFHANYFFDMSERSTGKTTNYIIAGLIYYKKYREYGAKIEYIRLTKDGIMPKNARNLFSTIEKYGYINIIFNGKWNSIEMKPRAWYLCFRDDSGKIIDIDNQECCHMHSLEDKEIDAEKSVYTSLGDFCIVDEFIPVNGINTEQQFLNLMQLISTIRRLRLSFKVFMLANTINLHCHFFREFEISDKILNMKKGNEKIVTSGRGVLIWVHLIAFSEETSDKRIYNNLKYVGFKNPKLNSIIGGEQWETKNYPHLPRALDNENREPIEGYIYFNYYGRYLRYTLYFSDYIGTFVLVSPCTDFKNKGDSIIYTLEKPERKNERYLHGSGDRLDKLVLGLVKQNRVYFTDNQTGSLFDAFCNEAKILNK